MSSLPRLRALAALTCLVVAASPAVATDDPVVEVDGGLTCGMYSMHPLGLTSDPNERLAIVWAGPWAATGTPETLQIVLTCAISVNDDVYGPGDVVVASSSSNAPVAVIPPTLVSYQAASAVPVHLCTHVTVYRDGRPPYVRQYDADGNPANGPQCARAREAGTLAEVYATPSTPDGICARADNLPSPPSPFPYHEVCTPWWPGLD